MERHVDFIINGQTFIDLRLYARGEQSIAKYKNELAVDGDLSYLKLRLDSSSYHT